MIWNSLDNILGRFDYRVCVEVAHGVIVSVRQSVQERLIVILVEEDGDFLKRING